MISEDSFEELLDDLNIINLEEFDISNSKISDYAVIENFYAKLMEATGSTLRVFDFTKMALDDNALFHIIKGMEAGLEYG